MLQSAPITVTTVTSLLCPLHQRWFIQAVTVVTVELPSLRQSPARRQLFRPEPAPDVDNNRATISAAAVQ